MIVPPTALTAAFIEYFAQGAVQDFASRIAGHLVRCQKDDFTGSFESGQMSPATNRSMSLPCGSRHCPKPRRRQHVRPIGVLYAKHCNIAYIRVLDQGLLNL